MFLGVLYSLMVDEEGMYLNVQVNTMGKHLFSFSLQVDILLLIRPNSVDALTH